MDSDRKEERRTNFKSKKTKKTTRDYILDKKEKSGGRNVLKRKKVELDQEEIWEQWEDEIY